MRKIVETPLARLGGLMQSFAAQTAVLLSSPVVPQNAGCHLWLCQLNVLGPGGWAAVYAGPSSGECWSYLAWREVELPGGPYREAVGLYTEPVHEKKGLAKAVLDAALPGDIPLMSDRDGLTFPAFRLLHRRALRGGASILDLHTGQRSPVSSFPVDVLWHDGPDCERLQLIFSPTA